MLAIFRRSQRLFLWILLVVIIVAFVFWGSRPSDFPWTPARARTLGFIGSRAIKDTDLSYAIRGVLIALGLRGVTRDMISDTKELERDAWFYLAQTEAARRENLSVGPQELEQVIRSLFFRNNPVDRASYRAIISRLAGAMSEREFEQHLSDLILTEKPRHILASTVIITDQDRRQAYDAERTLAKFAYVPFFSSNYIANQDVSTNEIEEFFKANENEFKKPAQVDLIFAIAHLNTQAVTVTEEEIAAFYEDNKERFAITNSPAALTNDTDITEEPPKSYLPLAEVADLIRTNLLHAKALEASYDLAEQLAFAMADPAARTSAERADLFRSKAAALGLSTLESGWISLADPLPGITNAYEIVRATFSLKPGDLTDVSEIPGVGHALVFLRDKRDAYTPTLDEAFDEVRQEIIRRRALDAARLAASQLKNRLESLGLHLTNATSLGYTVTTTIPIDRHASLEDISCPPEVIARLFAYPENSLVVAPFNDGFMLVSPLEFIEPDPVLMYAEADNITQRLTRQTENILYNLWLQQTLRDVRITQPLQQEPQEESLPE